MDDYIVLVSTVSLASLLLALMWILKRVESQADRMLPPCGTQEAAEESRPAVTSEKTGSAGGDDCIEQQPTVQEHDSLHPVMTAQAVTPEIQVDKDGGEPPVATGVKKQVDSNMNDYYDADVLWEDEMEAGDVSRLDLRQILCDLEDEVGLRFITAPKRPEFAIEEFADTDSRPDYCAAAPDESQFPPSVDDTWKEEQKDESGVFDLNVMSESVEWSSGSFPPDGPISAGDPSASKETGKEPDKEGEVCQPLDNIPAPPAFLPDLVQETMPNNTGVQTVIPRGRDLPPGGESAGDTTNRLSPGEKGDGDELSRDFPSVPLADAASSDGGETGNEMAAVVCGQEEAGGNEADDMSDCIVAAGASAGSQPLLTISSPLRVDYREPCTYHNQELHVNETRDIQTKYQIAVPSNAIDEIAITETPSSGESGNEEDIHMADSSPMQPETLPFFPHSNVLHDMHADERIIENSSANPGSNIISQQTDSASFGDGVIEINLKAEVRPKHLSLIEKNDIPPPVNKISDGFVSEEEQFDMISSISVSGTPGELSIEIPATYPAADYPAEGIMFEETLVRSWEEAHAKYDVPSTDISGEQGGPAFEHVAGLSEKVSFVDELTWQFIKFHSDAFPNKHEHPGLYAIIAAELKNPKYALVCPEISPGASLHTNSQNASVHTDNQAKIKSDDVHGGDVREAGVEAPGVPLGGGPDVIPVYPEPGRFRSEAFVPIVSVSPEPQTDRKIEEEVKEEDSKSTILAKQKNFNENCCMRCFSRFFFIFNQKVQCLGCKYFVCKNCSDYDKEEKEYICKVCQKQSELQNQTCDWFYTNVKKKFKRFGSAKVVRSLYKRKTESDSENDSGYHPALYNTEPIGKRSRQSLGGLFDIDINGEDPSNKELRATESTPGGKLRNDDYSDTSLVEEEIIAERHEKKYSIPFSCAVATGQDSFSHVYDAEVKEFKKQLEGIITDIHRTLDVQSPDIISPEDNNLENFEKTVTNHKLNISSAISNLAQSLHIAVDNQDPHTTSGKPVSPTAKHQLVKQTLVKEVELFTGHPIDIGEEPTSEYASEDGSQASDTQSQRSYEDILADFMLKKVVEDFQKAQEEVDRREEAALERSLKRLENRANVTLLNDMLSGVSESETDDPMSSAPSRLDDTVSDVEFSELSLSTKDIGDSPIADMSSPRLYSQVNGFTENSNQKGLDINENRTGGGGGDTVDHLSNQDRHRTPHEESLWSAVESKMSPLVSTAPQFSRREYAGPDGDNRMHSTPGRDSDTVMISSGGGRGGAREDMNDSDNTLEGSPNEGSMIEEVNRGRSSPGIHQSSMLDYAQGRRIPLPSFTDDEVVGLPEVDLDDISRRGDDDDEAPRSSNWESEITFNSQWKFDSGGLFHDRTISAYDNCGEKKVGLDGEGPVIMLVPKLGGEGGDIIKVGDRDIDEVSELSENDAPSDISLDASDDEDLAEAAQKVTREISTMTDSCAQTEAKEEETTAADAEVARAARATALASELPPLSSEADEVDPKFVVRPTNVTVVEGEPMKLECEVAGTDPIDVFWYKDTLEVSSLEEDERSDVTIHDNKHSVDVYNTSKADAGQYLCIGVSDQGQCNQSFNVTIQENTNEKSPPEFIKELHDIDVVVGQSVKFRCKVRGYPLPRVLWYRDGKRIKTCDQYRVEKYGNRDYVLWLEYASLEDDAEYMVVARNMVGEAKSKAQLMVEATEEALQERSEREDRDKVVSPDVLESTKVPETLYPDTNELLRLAEQVSATRNDVNHTSKKAATSARQFTTLNKQLDEMDRRLETLQDEVVDTMNNNSGSSWGRQGQSNDDLQSSAYAVREVTSSALGVLAEAQLTRNDRNQIVIHRENIDPDEEEVEINLSFKEFEKLYAAGKISSEQMKTGKVRRKDKKMIEDYLRLEAQYGAQNDLDRRSHELTLDEDGLKVFDCGLKRVDSKRYNRDYVVYRDQSPQVARRNSLVSPPPPSQAPRPQPEPQAQPAPQRSFDVVKSTPAGQREDVHAEICKAEEEEFIDHVHEQTIKHEEKLKDYYLPSQNEAEIYMAAGKVYDLESKVRELEGQVVGIDEDTSPWDMAKLESQVAAAVAQVSANEEEVTEIEKSLEQTFQEAPNMPGEWKRALKSSRRQSERFDDTPNAKDYIDHRQSMQLVRSTPPAAPRQPTHQPASSVSQSEDRHVPVESPVSVQTQQLQHRNIHSPEPADNNNVFDENLSPVEVAPPRRESEQLSGETEEGDVPESRAEYDEEDIQLPSVKNLMSRFNQPGKAGSSDASVKRVYSLTGRDIPRTIREKLKKQGPSVVPNTNVRNNDSQYEVQRRPIASIFEDPSAPVEPHQVNAHRASPSNVNEIYPHAYTEQPLTSSAQDLANASYTTTSSGATVKRSQSFDSHPVRRSQSFDAQAGLKPAQTQPRSREEPPRRQSLGAPKKGRNSTIMARAAFWDSRIHEGVVSDDTLSLEFPIMPDDSFKSDDHEQKSDW